VTTAQVNVRITEDQRQALVRWATENGGGGLSAAVRRLINKEMDREQRERDEQRAG
jgi:hypothetical protein